MIFEDDSSFNGKSKFNFKVKLFYPLQLKALKEISLCRRQITCVPDFLMKIYISVPIDTDGIPERRADWEKKEEFVSMGRSKGFKTRKQHSLHCPILSVHIHGQSI